MKSKSTIGAEASGAGFAALLEACAGLTFEPHDIAEQLDEKGHYEIALDREFPFSIKLFRFSSQHHTRGQTWHERLELFTPLDGPARFRMGNQEVQLARGEVLVVDNLKLHHVVDFPGFDTRVVVISFLPEFVYSLGSPSFDYAFLLPFYTKLEKQPHIARLAEPAAARVGLAMAGLVRCYFQREDQPFLQIGCKACLLEILYHMACLFKGSELLKWEFVRQQQRTLQLKKLFDHISRHYAAKLSVGEAARLAGMSPPQFMKNFKKVSGMTLVAYLNHVRLTNAARLLKETNQSIAEIAFQVGFADQSHFDKRFKRSFGMVPKEFRFRKTPGLE